MIGLKGTLSVIDNSGALVAECINVLKVKTRLKSTGFASVGDEIVCVINKARPLASGSNAPSAGNIQKVRRGDIRRAVIVRTRKPELRPDGRYVGSERWYRRWATERGRQSEGVKDHEDSEDGAGIETLKSYMVEWEKHLKRSQLGRYACRGELAESGPRRRIRFDDSACVLLNNKGEMIGTRVNGVVSASLRDLPGGAGGPGGRWSKILALATKATNESRAMADAEKVV